MPEMITYSAGWPQIKETVSSSLEDVMDILDNTLPDSVYGLSMPAFMSATGERLIMPSVAKNTLRFLGSTGVISFGELGDIVYPAQQPI